jgi:PAS domain S-box-containing protein
MKNFELTDSVPNFYLELSNDYEENMLKKVLKDGLSFDFTTNILRDHLTKNHDIGVFDWKRFLKKKKLIKKLKEKVEPLFLPIILIAKESVTQKLTKEDWHLINDVINPPISKNSFKARIKNLLSLRMQSLRLNRQNNLSNKALNSIANGVIITDANQEDNPIIFCNRGFEQTTGYKIEDVMGKNCRFMQNSDEEQKGLKILREAIKEEQSARVLLRNYKKNGDLFWNELTISPIEDDNSENKYFVGVQNDVTPLVEARSKLQKLVDEKTTLLKEIHHRIKNNLAIIVALLEFKIIETDQKEVLNILNETKHRIFSIAKVHELLYEHENLHEIRFDTYIKNLVKHLQTSYNTENKHIKFSLKLNPLSLDLDQAVPCGMILSELVTNSIKYAFPNQEAGTIMIRLNMLDEQLKISVKDNGVGLREDKSEENIFDETSIVKILLKQLNADYHTNIQSGFGLSFQFFPKNYSGPSSNL